MSQSPALPNVESLGVSERIELLGRIWDSLIDSGRLPPPPAWHLDEIKRRIARADAQPGTGIPLEQLRKELLGD